MKRQVLVIGLVVLAGLAPLFAQASATARFNVPFEFVVGDVTLPAGEYTVNYEAKTSLIQVGKTGGGVSAIVLTMPSAAKLATASPTLVFNRYGAKSFLSEIWVNGEQIGRAIHKTSYEKEMMAQGLKTKSIQIAAK